jgi:hypothetical protein
MRRSVYAYMRGCVSLVSLVFLVCLVNLVLNREASE